MTFKGRLLLSRPMLKLFFRRKFRLGPKMAVLREKGGVNVKLVLRPRRGTPLRRTASFEVFCVNVRGGWTGGVSARLSVEPKK